MTDISAGCLECHGKGDVLILVGPDMGHERKPCPKCERVRGLLKAEREAVLDFFNLMIRENELGRMGQAPEAAHRIALYGSAWRTCKRMWEERIAKEMSR